MWTLGGNLAKSLIGFGLSILLARLLQPSDYGLVGMVLVVISILTVLLDLGLGKAVVYFTEEEASLPVCHTVTVASGIILTAVSFWSAPLVADFYKDARLTVLLRVLSVNLLLGSFRAVPLGKLTKQFRFREVTILETVSGISAGIIGVLLAWKGFGVWSLVTNLLLSEFLLTVLVYFVQPVSFTLHLRRDMLQRLLRWGLPFTGSALLWQFYDNADKLIVGRMLGTTPLGFYSFASRLAMLPGERISAVINRVSFSSFSAIKHQRDDVVRHWLSLTRKLALLVFPILMVLALLAEDFLLVVVNRKWLPAALPVKFLCFMVALKAVQTIMTTVVTTQGRTDVTLRFALLNTLVLPVSFWLGALTGSLAGIGLAWCLAYPPICAYLLVQTCRITGLPVRRYFAELRRPAVVAILCGLVTVPGLLFLPPGAIRFFLNCTLAGGCLVLCLLSEKEMRELMLSMIRSRPSPK
jgi:O-antigen/teichoic acid export membrane protein